MKLFNLAFIFFGNVMYQADAADLFGAIGSLMGIGNNNGNGNQYENTGYNTDSNNNFGGSSINTDSNQYPAYPNNNFGGSSSNVDSGFTYPSNNFGGSSSNVDSGFTYPNNNFGGSTSNVDSGFTYPNNNFGGNNNNGFAVVPDNNFGGSSINNNGGQFTFTDPSKDNEDNIFSNTGNGRDFGLSEDEKLAAQQYPGLKNLLDKLKALNQKLEQQKQKEQGQNGFNNGNNNNNIDNGYINGGNCGDEVTNNGWKVSRRRKFAIQARAVRPDNEKVSEKEVVYYLD